MADTTETTGSTAANDAATTNQTPAVAGTAAGAAATTTASPDAAKTDETVAAADGVAVPTKADEVTLKDDDTLAGDHTNQTFGNTPANPALPDNLPETDKTVRLSRVTPDHPEGPVYCDVHPDMVGDYLRAGWNVEI